MTTVPHRRPATPTVADPIVQAQDLTLTASNGRRVLDGLTLRIGPGERVLVIGASGSGKSTLLRAIAGVSIGGDLTATGSLWVGGVPVLGESMSAVRRDTGWLPQDPAAAVCLPVVADDVAFACENRAVDRSRISPMVDAALRRVDAVDLWDRDTGTLSDGQAQRVGLAAATVTAPAVLLLDEPTSLLDPTAMSTVHQAITGVADTTMLLVEHRLDELAARPGALPERVLVLADGRLVADGPTERVLTERGSLVHELGCWLPSSVELDLPRPATPATPACPVRTGSRSGEGGETALSTTDLAVGYSAPVLTGVTLDLTTGSVTAVVGANGAGKSTLLRTMAGVQQPLAGQIVRPAGRPGLVFADPEHQFVAPTVRQEVGWGGLPADRIDAALGDYGLAALADARPYRLSGGEKRRLSLASMAAGPRRTLLADEPTFGLDRTATRQVQAALHRAARQDRCVLFSCHDLRVVAETADRLLVLADGRVIADGPPLALLRDPAVRAAAGLRLPPLLRTLLLDGGDDTEVAAALTALAGPTGTGPTGTGPTGRADV